MIQKFFQLLAAIAVFCIHVNTSAEDIDLFVGIPPSTAEVPNVLIVVDNTANWNSAFANEKAALVNVFNGMPVNKFRVGMMMFTETGSGNGGSDGGYVRAAARLVTASNKGQYAAMINALDSNGDKSNGGKVAKAMEEAYLYLTGGTPHAGNDKNKTDYTGNTAGNASDDAVHALAGNALTSKTGSTYQRPGGATVDCVKNYIIYISNGAAQDNSSDITQANAALTAAGGTTTQIALSPSGSQDNPADEWARFMRKSALKASVYTIDVNKVTTGQGPGWTALLKSMANQSSGRYFDVSSTGSGIQDALNTILSEVLSVNSVFASVSLPVSVNTQGTYLNQVFIGMFRPDGDGAPRWNGNLKQYKMALVGGDLQLVDADGATATNNQTGFITECARSYWTPATTDTEWTQGGESDCLSVTGAAASNYPDGNQVGKGGQAYKLRAQTRTALTCATSTCSSVVTFNNTNVTATMLGVASNTERDNVVNWSKGMDNYEDEDIDGSATDARLSTHGDVVHSRPVAVNFDSTGTEAAAKVVVFYGANDGWFRAINGNRSNAIGSYAAGQELWSFMPAEFLTKVDRLRKRSPVVSYPNTPATGATAKDYGMDGPITAYQGTIAAAGASKTFIYATMRRGGRSIYAFDVTDTLTAPASPTFKWRIGCQIDGTCTSDLSGLGQTWSPIKTFKHPNYDSGDKPLLIFGGGYDTCEDTDNGTVNHSCTSTSKGHYVYVMDGDTGAHVKTFDTGGTRGIVSDVVIVSDGGNARYGYVPDLGGNVYRIDMQGAPSAWTMTKIASLGCDTASTCDANRKFMFPPSVVKTPDGYYTILIGSGDREKPILNSSTATPVYKSSAAVANNFFAFVDKPGVSGYPGTADCGVDLICVPSLYAITAASTTVDSAALALKKGWYLNMNATEQVVTTALTVFSSVSFSTHAPADQNTVAASGSCSNLGTTRVYNVSLTDASTKNGTANRYEDVAGDGLPPSGVAGLVTLDNTGQNGNLGQTVPFIFGRKSNPVDPDLPTNSASSVMPRNRLYWYIQKQ